MANFFRKYFFLLFFLIISVAIHPMDVEWHNTILLEIYPPDVKGSEREEYLGSTFSLLIYQELAVIRKIPSDQIYPSRILYPEKPPEKSNDEDTDLIRMLREKKTAEMEVVLKKKGDLPPEHLSLHPVSYSLTTIMNLEKENIRYQVRLFLHNNEIFSREYNFQKESMMEASRAIALDIRKLLSGDESAHLRIETSPPGAQVYLEGVFAGESPLVLESIPYGEYRIKILKDKYMDMEKKISIGNPSAEISLVLAPRTGNGKIAIETSEPGMEVYLDNLFRGKTPLVIPELEWKTYTLFLRKKGFMDVYRKLTVRPEEPEHHLRVTVTRGDSLERWEKRGTLYGLRYDHLVTGHLVLAGGSFLSYLYYTDKRYDTEDYLYAHYLNNSSMNDPGAVSALRADVSRFGRYADISLGITAYGLVGSIFFYWLKVKSLDPGDFITSYREDRQKYFYASLDPVSGRFQAGYRMMLE